MDYTYNIVDFANTALNINRMTDEIKNSTITIALDHIVRNDNTVIFKFKTELSDSEEDSLTSLVNQHTGEALAVNEVVNTMVVSENIKFYESGDQLNGLFSTETWDMDILQDQAITSKEFSFKFDVSLLMASMGITDVMIGDEVEVHMAPNTIIGVIVQPVAPGDAGIYVSPTVIENIKVGYFVIINGAEIGQVKSIDGNYIALCDPVSDGVNATAMTYVGMTIKLVKHIRFVHTHTMAIGSSITTGQRIPANVVTKIIYKNNNNTEKMVSFYIEHLY